MKLALGLTGGLDGAGESTVSSRKGLGCSLYMTALSLPGLRLRNWELLGSNRPMLLLGFPKGLTHIKDE